MEILIGKLYIDLTLNQIGLAWFNKQNKSIFIIFYGRWIPMGLNILGKVLINKNIKRN